MKMIHLLVGSTQAKQFAEKSGIQDDENEEVIGFEDNLNHGPLKTEKLSFSEGRTAYRQSLMPEQQPGSVTDLERLMLLSTELSNDPERKVCFWFAANADEVIVYYWLLHYLKKHQGRFFVINISGLPFINDQGKLFYPDLISDLPSKELIKAKKLMRNISVSEWESEGEEWKKLIEENASLRLLDGLKTISSAPLTYFDADLLTNEAKKPNKILQLLKAQHKINSSLDAFLLWRINQLLSNKDYSSEEHKNA